MAQIKDNMISWITFVPGLKFLCLIFILVIAALVSSVVGLFEMIVEQNELGRKISKYSKYSKYADKRE